MTRQQTMNELKRLINEFEANSIENGPVVMEMSGDRIFLSGPIMSVIRFKLLASEAGAFIKQAWREGHIPMPQGCHVFDDDIVFWCKAVDQFMKEAKQ